MTIDPIKWKRYQKRATDRETIMHGQNHDEVRRLRGDEIPVRTPLQILRDARKEEIEAAERIKREGYPDIHIPLG